MARTVFAGGDMQPWTAHLLRRLSENQHDANAFLDLSTALQLVGQRDLGLSMQALALQMQQLYQIRCAAEKPAVRVLALVSPGDLAENNTLELLVEDSDIALDLLYVSPKLPVPAVLPEYDVAIVAVCESDVNRPLLRYIEGLLTPLPWPVLCRPHRIARLSRAGACSLLQSRPGLVVPVTRRIGRSELAALRDGFPRIARPVDSQKGFGLRRLAGWDEIPAYLQDQHAQEFFVAPYVDYRSADGQFRKYRVVLIDGRPYGCHMCVWDRWMIHYKNTGMLENAAKRAEEQRFFETFDEDFGARHGDAFRYIAEQLELEYVGVDCGETREGELLLFEVDSGMTVHSMDPVDIFPYKQPQMRKVFRAFRQMLLDHTR
jgi:hypothetical protein